MSEVVNFTEISEPRFVDRELNFSKLRDVIIYPYYECNLRCRGCPVSSPAGQGGLFRSPPDAFRYHIDLESLEYLTSWNVKVITVLGGEPFLSMALPYMMKVLRNTDAVINVYTNATLLTGKDETDTFLREMLFSIDPPDYLTISTEGSKFWTDKVRGNVYEKCMNVLNWLLDSDYAKPVIRCSFWHEYACPQCGDTVLVYNKSALCRKCGWFDADHAMYQPLDLIREIEKLNNMGVPVETAPRIGIPPMPRARMRWFFTALSSMKHADCLLPSYKNFLGIKYLCPAGWNRLVLNPQGMLTGCQWGNGYFAHITWDDDRIVEAARAYVSRWNPIRPECYGCERLPYCRSSCKMVQDYRECPVKDRTLGEGEHVVVDGETRVVRRSLKVTNLRLMRRKLSPGVC